MKKLLIISFAVVIALTATALVLAQSPEPLGITNKALGGSELNEYTPGVHGGVGLNNIGLLVRTSGRVTYVDTTNQFFYIDDGSALQDGSKKADNNPTIGIRVSYKDLAPGNMFNPPLVGQYVAITGISSTTQITLDDQSTRIIPTLRPRRQDDMTIEQY
ncbi:MAG TPA: hypothetical protein PLU88_09500 [Armatimonadota bacterium]|nr:hypothetical protein [Armatimonadota bacterium]